MAEQRGVALRYSIHDIAVREGMRRLEEFDPRAMFEEIGGYLVSSTTQRFLDGKAPDGSAWPASQRATNTGGKTLVHRGHLRDSNTYAVEPGGDGVRVGSNLIYAAAHQFGKTEPERVPAHNRLVTQAFGQPLPFGVWAAVGAYTRNPNLPARPFLGLSEDDRDEIDAIVTDHLRRLLP